MTTSTEILDALLARLDEQVAKLNARGDELLSQLAADPALLEQTGAKSPASQLAENQNALGALRTQLIQLTARREEAERSEREEALRSHRETHRSEMEAAAIVAHQQAAMRVTLGKEVDALLSRLGAVLQKLEDVNAEIVGSAFTVAKVAMVGSPQQNAAAQAIGHDDKLRNGAATNAFLHQLMQAGIGQKGIPADVLMRLSMTVHPDSVGDAMVRAKHHTQNLMKAWLQRAFGSISPEVDAELTVPEDETLPPVFQAYASRPWWTQEACQPGANPQQRHKAVRDASLAAAAQPSPGEREPAASSREHFPYPLRERN